MTLGEKIRFARKSSGLSQEQLAEKLCVSRSAIAKWETDKGIPDIENLKILSRLLNISLDTLLDDSADPGATVIREPYHLAAYGRGCDKVKKDRMMRQRFPEGQIFPLLARPELPNEAGTLDSTLGFLTPAPFGTPEFLKSVRDMEKDFYLVDQGIDQYFVTVTNTTLEIRPLPQKLTEKTFHLGTWRFIRCDHLTAP